MKLSDQVITLETAKKLKELGIKRDNIYWHIIDNKNESYIINNNDNDDIFLLYRNDIYAYNYAGCQASYSLTIEEKYAAFTASEIMNMLPSRINILDYEEPFDNYRFNMSACHISMHGATKFIKHYAINYHCDTLAGDEIFCHPRQLFDHNIINPNLAECCALVLIMIIEKEYIKA